MASIDDDALAETATTVRRAASRLNRRLRTERTPDTLSVNKLLVLGHLYRNGPAAPGALAAAEHQQPQSLTRVFAELEEAGLIGRDQDDADRRKSVLWLTADGMAALARDARQRDLWLAQALAGLTRTEREVLRLAAALMDRIADAEV